MNCYNHPEQPAVAQCPDCGKGLCTECAALYANPICRSCNRKRINEDKRVIIMEMLLTFGVGLVLAILFVRLTEDGHTYPFWFKPMIFTMAFYLFSGIVPGWQALTRLAPNRSRVTPRGWWVFVLGWLLMDLIFVILKLAISLCVGLVMLPIRTVRNVSRLVSLLRVKT